MISKTTTLIMTLVLGLFVSAQLAFAAPTKAFTKNTASQKGPVDNPYGVSKLSKSTMISQGSELVSMASLQKSPIPTPPSSSDPIPGDKIHDLVWEEMDGWHSASGFLIGQNNEPVEILIEVGPQGNGEITLQGDSGQLYQAFLNQDRMEIRSEESDDTATETWLRPSGDLLDFLDRRSRNTDIESSPQLLEGLSQHDAARGALDEVASHAGGAFAQFAQRLQVAEAVYSAWKDATTGSEEMIKHATVAVPTDEGQPPVASCTYPDTGTATTTEQSINIAKFADLTVSSAKVHVTAFCEGRGGCLKPDAKVTFQSLNNGTDDGSNGCPQDGTEWGDEEFKVAILNFDAFATVGRGCALNFDNADKAVGFSAELTVKGMIEASVKGTEAAPEGLGGSSIIHGTAVVCYEDDPISNDLQDVMLSGSSNSWLDKGV